jgi:uncharacterized membrane protein YidH (DUF202 family)
LLHQVTVFLDKATTVVLDLQAQTMVVVVVVVLGVLAAHVTQKHQVTEAQAHLTLYQDHYNIIVVAAAQV